MSPCLAKVKVTPSLPYVIPSGVAVTSKSEDSEVKSNSTDFPNAGSAGHDELVNGLQEVAATDATAPKIYNNERTISAVAVYLYLYLY